MYGLEHDILTADQYALLVAVVFAAAIVPTLIAQRWFFHVRAEGRGRRRTRPGSRERRARVSIVPIVSVGSGWGSGGRMLRLGVRAPLGPLENDRSDQSSRLGAPSHISKTVLSTIHVGPTNWTRSKALGRLHLTICYSRETALLSSSAKSL